MNEQLRRGRPATFDRHRVLDQLTELFWLNGFDHTSHADMRELTGLSGSSLSHAFGDKGAIFDAVLDHYHDLTEEIIEPLNGPAKGIDAVLDWIDFFGGAIVNPDKPKGCLMIASLAQPVAHSPTAKTRIDRYVRRLREQLVAAFTHAATEGDVAHEDVTNWVALVESSYIGTVVASRSGESTEELELRIAGMRTAVSTLRNRRGE